MFGKMHFALFIALAASLVHAQDFGAMMRFGCAQHSVERLDPVVTPGQIPSQHMHAIVGGDSFASTMKGDIGAQSSCTTCTFSDDFSNYWHPALYFRAKNGTFHYVPIIPNVGIFGAEGGMTVYYTSPTDKSVKIKAPPPGFRMVVGNPYAREQSFSSAYSIYRCYTDGPFEPNPMGVADSDTQTFPEKHCPGGMRVNINFPNCWDGKNLDSKDHKSHVAGGYNGCPSTHPVQLPQIMLETVFDTGRFPKEDWPEDGRQPFVWAQGDGTGYGYHADYVFGWKGNSLQKAVDQRCSLNTCSGLKTQEMSVGNTCTKKPSFGPPVLSGWIKNLPGKMKVTYKA